MKRFALIVLLATSAALAFCLGIVRAEDWTVKGKTYYHVHVSAVNADTVSITYEGGAGRINLSDLTPELQAKFSAAAKEAKILEVYEKRAATDPIAHLVVELSSTYGMLHNGGARANRLPADASPEEITAEALKSVRLKYYKIVRVESVHIKDSAPRSYTAVLIQTDSGAKVVLLYYVDQNLGWWNRVYDSYP